ncbi:MAG: type III-A CRISPR-associated protein Csm2 [Truepera sp.]|nr:type III-A CRISPR-associated protein Csm2 [Truepera sp.]
MKEYFQDAAKGLLKPHLFDEEAQRDAKKLLSAQVTRVQVRRYFGEVRALQARFHSEKSRSGAEAFARIQPYLGLLKAKAHYGRRNNSKTNDMVTFSEFMNQCIDGVHDDKGFEAMVKYLEAVVAYFMPEAKEGR